MTSSFPNDSIPIDEIPVLLTIYNRPDKTKAVIDNLRQIRPKQIFVAADGPRNKQRQVVEKCLQAREILKTIDWSCEIKTRFLEKNMGVDLAVSTAIDWFFQNVDYGIILEDDGIVHSDFFLFCGELFVRFFNDVRIMQISSLAPYDQRDFTYDYHFSPAFRCSGGWATWRRAWKCYSSDFSRYSDSEAFKILKVYNRDYSKFKYQYGAVLKHRRGIVTIWDHWDYQWNMACFAQNGLSIVPEKNLLINIGFDEEGTHTKQISPVFANVELQSLRFPLRHPPFVYADWQPEKNLEIKIFCSMSFKSKCMYILRRALSIINYLREVMPYRSKT